MSLFLRVTRVHLIDIDIIIPKSIYNTEVQNINKKKEQIMNWLILFKVQACVHGVAQCTHQLEKFVAV